MKKINMLERATENIVELWNLEFDSDIENAMETIYNQLNQYGKDMIIKYACLDYRVDSLNDLKYLEYQPVWIDFLNAFDVFLNLPDKEIWKSLSIDNQIKAIKNSFK